MVAREPSPSSAAAPKPPPTADQLIAVLLRYVRSLQLEDLGPLADARYMVSALAGDKYLRATGPSTLEALKRFAHAVAQLERDRQTR